MSNNSALFVVGSPLQAICACEAIHHYKFQDFKIVVAKTNSRSKQVTDYLSEIGMPYTTVQIKHPRLAGYWGHISVFNIFKRKFDCLFLGDYRMTLYKLLYLQYVKNNGKVNYLDDGNYILLHANGMLKRKPVMRFRDNLFEMVAKCRGISTNNYFTFYADDLTNTSWNVEKNMFSCLQSSNKSIGKVVYIVGTNTTVYCDFLGISDSSFQEKQRQLFDYIKCNHSDCMVFYFPHGRDLCKDNKTSCEKNGVIFSPIDKCLELYSLQQEVIPVAIYGYTSTALYTLHLFFPDTKVVNVSFSGNNTNGVEAYEKIVETYNNKGIPTIKI